MLDRAQRRAFLIIAAVISAVPIPIQAIEAADLLIFSREPVSIRPQLTVTEVYNDNILYNEEDPVSDLITTVSPGLDIQVGRLTGNYVSVSYEYSQHFYLEEDELDAGEHRIQTGVALEGNRFRLAGGDRIDFLSSPLGGVEGTTVSGLRTVERMAFSDLYTLSYSLGRKTAVYIEGQHLSTDYESDVNLYDIRALVGTLGFAFLPTPRTSFFGEAYYGQTRTDPNSPTLPDNPKATFIGGFIGARGTFTERLTGVVKGGYEVREFSGGAGSSSAPVVEVSLNQRFSEKTQVSLSYSRRQEVSVQFTRQAFTLDNVRVQLQQALGSAGKWNVALGGTYTHYDYEEVPNAAARQYSQYTANFNLVYQIQLWLTASLGYSFEKLQAETEGLAGYDVNRVTFRVSIGY